MAALPVIAAAALGFAGAQTTSFVLPRATQTPAAAAAPHGVSAQIPTAQQSGAYCGALCAGLTLGAGAAAISSRIPRRGRDVGELRPFHVKIQDKPKALQDTIEGKPVWIYEEGTWERAEEDIENFAGGIVGSEAAFGTFQYDPLGFSVTWPEHVPWFREAELKHGRICMVGIIGLIAQDSFRIPIPELEDPTLTILNSHNKLIYGIGQGPMWWLLVFCAVIESKRFADLGLGFEKLTHENAGDLDFGKQFLPKTEEGILQMKLKELKNGRLAMLAFAGCITQAAFFSQPHFPFYQP